MAQIADVILPVVHYMPIWYNTNAHTLSINSYLLSQENVTMKKRLAKLALAVGAGLSMVTGLLVVSVVMAENAVQGGKTAMQKLPDMVIQFTLAQTASVGSVSSDVDATLTTFVPDYKVYIIAAIIISLALWLLVRAIRSGKSA